MVFISNVNYGQVFDLGLSHISWASVSFSQTTDLGKYQLGVPLWTKRTAKIT